MKAIKKLIPAAIVAGFAGAASADVSLYGLIDMSVGKSNLGAPTSEVGVHSGGDNSNSQGNSTTRIGVKGNNDLGGGLKANFKFETNGITGAGEVNDVFFNRQAWFGLSGGFGEMRFGRQDSVAFQMMNQFDFNGASNGVSAAGYSGAAVWSPGRQSRAAQYIAPAMGGFKAQAGFAQNDETDTNTKDVASASVTFEAGALVVGASFETARVKKTTANQDGEDFASFAASYDLKVVKLMAGYADGGSVFDSNGDVAGYAKGPTLGVVAPVMGYSVGAHYAKNTEAKLVNYEFFINKEFKKNLYGYAEYGFRDLDGSDDKKKSSAIGMIYVF